MAKVIYMQDTINFMVKVDRTLIMELDLMGKPEIKSIEGAQYYVFEIE